MRIGSIVECVDNSDTNLSLNKPYTISDIIKARTVINGIIFGYSGLGIYLEEIQNNKTAWNGTPIPYKATRFRELLPPISNIEEHINSNTLEPCENSPS